MAVLLYFLLTKTRIGYEIRAMGENPAAARYAGISTLKVSLLVMTVGGSISGLAGYHVWAGIPDLYRISSDFFKYGDLAYYGIIAGLISGNRSLLAIPTSIFLSGIIVGSSALVRSFGIAFGADLVLMGILLLMLIAFQIFYRYRMEVTKP